MNKLIILSIASALALGGVVFFVSQRKEVQAPISQTTPTATPQNMRTARLTQRSPSQTGK